MASGDKINIPITTSYDDKEAKEALADAKALDKLEPEIEITADDKASADLKKVKEEADALAKADTEITIRAKIDAAKADLQQLQTELKNTGERAEDTARQLDRVDKGDGGGFGTRGNAISDLTGPLGDASSAASDFAGVFDGLGDIAEDVTGKLGLSAQAGIAVGSAVQGIGIAAAVGAAAWAYFSQKEAKAREEAEKLLKAQEKINDELAKGENLAAAIDLKSTYEAGFKAADKAGVSVEDFTKFLTGQIDTMALVDTKMQAYGDALHNSGDILDETSRQTNRQIIALQAQVDTMEDARAKYAEANGELEANADVTNRIANALPGLTQSQKDATQAVDEFGAKSVTAMGKFDDKQQSVFRGTRTQANLTEAAFDRLRGSLDMEQALLNLESQVKTALEKSDGHAQATQEEILGIKQSIIDVAEAAGLTPIEVQSLISNVTPENVNDVYTYATTLIKNKGAVKIQAEIQAAIDLAVRTRSTTIGGVRFPDNERPTSAAATQVFNFPRGMSVDAAMQLATSRSRNGGLYRRVGR